MSLIQLNERIGFHPGAMGISPMAVKGPCALGCDIRPGCWDVAIADVILARRFKQQDLFGDKELFVPRLVFYGKVTNMHTVLYLAMQYRVKFGVVDSRPEATDAGRLQAAAKTQGVEMWRAEYATNPTDVKCVENTVENKLRLERTMTLDDVHGAFQTGTGIFLPENNLEICGGNFVAELKNSTRAPERIHGYDWWVWKKTGDDHALHTLNYLGVAIDKGRLKQWGGLDTMGAIRGEVVSPLDEVLEASDDDDDVPSGLGWSDDGALGWGVS